MDLEAAVRYPTDDENWERTVLIGGGIHAAAAVVGLVGMVITYAVGFVTFGIGFLIGFPLLFLLLVGIQSVVLGYYVEVMRSTIAGNDEPPAFTDWKRHAKDGLYATAIVFGYQVPAFGVMVLGMGVIALLFGIGVATGNDSAVAGLGLIGMLVYLLVFLVAGAYSLASAYFMPISLCTYAHEGSLRGAFDLGRLKTVGFESDYAIGWLVAAAGAALLSMVFQLLAIVLVGFFVQFYGYAVLARVIAGAYADSLGIDPSDMDSASGSAWTERPAEHSPLGDS